MSEWRPSFLATPVRNHALRRDLPREYIFFLSGAVWAASLLFGGGTQRGLWSDLIPEVLALSLIAVSAPRAWPRLRQAPLLMALLVGVIAVPLLHLVPLPPALWQGLPGRKELADSLVDAGVAAGWSPLSLQPGQTWRSALSLLPGIALCLAGLTLDASARRHLVFVALAVAVTSVPLGMLQVLGGSTSPLDFYAAGGASSGRAIGFFANPNHTATFLATLIPLTAAALAPTDRAPPSVTHLVGAAAIILVLLVGLALSGSRSVLVLGAGAMLASAIWIPRPALAGLMTRRRAWAVAGLGALVVVPLALGMGLLAIFQRFSAADVAEDLRWTIASVTWTAAWPYFPVGSGVGTFEAAYQRHEPASAVVYAVVNHAHNDWLEIMLEAGVLGAGLALLWVVCLISSMRRLLKHGSDTLARAAVVGLWLISLHSVWDYPLRTLAVSALAGLLVSFTQPPSPIRG